MKALLLILMAGSLPPVLAQSNPPAARPLPKVEADRQRLRWKRHEVLQNDLARALQLPLTEVCRDIDGAPCVQTSPITLLEWLRTVGLNVPTPPGAPPQPALPPEALCAQLQRSAECKDAPYVDVDTSRGVHLMALGGNDPIFTGVYKPLDEPLVTTPLAVDRFVLSACGERAARDAVGPAQVFTRFNLKETVEPNTAGVRDQVSDLYRRLLARDGTPREIDAIVSMADGSERMTGEQFARLSCYAIATSKEFLFQ